MTDRTQTKQGGTMELSHDDVLEILKVLETADFEYFELHIGDTVIIANRNGAPQPTGATLPPGAAAEPSGAVAPSAAVTLTGVAASTAPASVAPAPSTDPTPTQPPGTTLVDVTAPMVGVFYRSPKPGAPPFAELGAEVKAGDTLGLVEVMKMFNAVTAPASGSVAEILVETGTFVEFGQPLLRIRASAT